MNNITSTISPIQRLIGLLSCAKVVHHEGQDLEDTAKMSIQLYDLLLANAMKPEVLPTIDATEYRNPMTKEQKKRIEKLIQDNKVDAAVFEGWLGGFYSEVKEDGLYGISAENAGHILDRPEKCLEAFAGFCQRRQDGGDGKAETKSGENS